MTWSTPPTWVPGQSIPSANLNILRDDLLETAPAKATTAGSHFAVTGPFAIAERRITQASINGSSTTTSTSYTDLATGGPGPALTVTTGVVAMSWLNAQMANSSSGSTTRCCIEISGATTSAATDNNALIQQADSTDDIRHTIMNMHTLTAGSNTFTVKYSVGSGTGTFLRRNEVVFPL